MGIAPTTVSDNLEYQNGTANHAMAGRGIRITALMGDVIDLEAYRRRRGGDTQTAEEKSTTKAASLRNKTGAQRERPKDPEDKTDE